MKLDILAIGAHPDDIELGCSGTVALHIAKGKKVGVLDLTKGEMGTRGTVEERLSESNEASKLLKLSVRENLGLRDAFFTNDEESQLQVIRCIRKYRPNILLINAPNDRHPDHGRGSELVIDASFLSGLRAIKTDDGDTVQAVWRPKAIYHYIQSSYIKPDIVVDISDYWNIKIKAIKAYKTQFYDPNSKEPDTFISKPGFLDFIEGRAKEFGQSVGVSYGEGFVSQRAIGVSDLSHLL